MSSHTSDSFGNVRGRAILMAAALLIALSAATAAWPQQAQPQVAPPQQTTPSAGQPPSAAPEPPARANPGLVEELGKLLKDSAAGLTSTLPSPRQALDGLNSGAKDATDGLKRIAPLSSQSMVTGRAMCPVSANGGADCKAASDQLCKEKGYKEGNSIDIESSQKCSAKSYFSGKGACRTENFVTRAVCQ